MNGWQRRIVERITKRAHASHRMRNGLVLALCIGLVLCGLRTEIAAAEELPPVAVHVTGKLLSVNRLNEIPPGLFGTTATALTRERVREWGIESVRLVEESPSTTPIIIAGARKDIPDGIETVVECFFNRTQPALLLAEKDWEERLVRLAETYGRNSRFTNRGHHVEFWNEPYGLWATPGINYDSRFYDVSAAAEGSPMKIKGWADPLKHLVWTRGLVALGVEDRVEDVLALAAAPGDLVEGDQFTFNDRRYELAQGWKGQDPTQTRAWSGQQNSEFYRWMFIPFAKALKQTNPEVRLIGGWGFSPQTDDWAAWNVLYKPLIDDGIEWLDGLNEHHFGGDTRAVAGSYEVMQTYARTKFRRSLQFYNTQAAGVLEPALEADGAAVDTADSLATARGAMNYMLRDIIHLIDVCPDKAAARAADRADVSGGEEFAFRMLKELRGRLVATSSLDDRIWCVASTRGKRYCVLLFNDDSVWRTVALDVAKPGGSMLFSGRQVHVGDDGENLVLETEDLSGVEHDGWKGDVTLRPHAAVKFVFDLSADVDAPFAVVRTQYFAEGILHRVEPGESLTLQVRLPREKLKSIKGAALKIVQEGCAARGVEFELNGHPQPFEVRNTWTHRQRVDTAQLEAQNELTFRCAADAASGFTIDMASLMIDY